MFTGSDSLYKYFLGFGTIFLHNWYCAPVRTRSKQFSFQFIEPYFKQQSLLLGLLDKWHS